jgi:hypothetical protein
VGTEPRRAAIRSAAAERPGVARYQVLDIVGEAFQAAWIVAPTGRHQQSDGDSWRGIGDQDQRHAVGQQLHAWLGGNKASGGAKPHGQQQRN